MTSRLPSIELNDQTSEQPPKRGLGHQRLQEFVGNWKIEVRNGDTWERASISVSGGIMMTHWERTADGVHWRPLCDLTGTKVT